MSREIAAQKSFTSGEDYAKIWNIFAGFFTTHLTGEGLDTHAANLRDHILSHTNTPPERIDPNNFTLPTNAHLSLIHRIDKKLVKMVK